MIATTNTNTDPLSLFETQVLAQCEDTITLGLETFVTVGEALRTIRDERLYRGEYETFDAYVQQRWQGLGGRRQADRMIAAAAVADNLRPIGLSVANEAQARELTKLPAEAQRAVVQAVAASGPVTAAALRQEVQARTAPTLPPLPTVPLAWVIWRTETGHAMMRHESGLTIGPDADPQALVAEAKALARFLSVLANGWRVFDSGAGYTALHETHERIAAANIPHLALAAWRAGLADSDIPDLPDEILNAAWLAGWEFVHQARNRYTFRRNGNAVWEATAQEWRWELGLPDPAPSPDLVVPVSVAQQEASTVTQKTWSYHQTDAAGDRLFDHRLIQAGYGWSKAELWSDGTWRHFVTNLKTREEITATLAELGALVAPPAAVAPEPEPPAFVVEVDDDDDSAFTDELFMDQASELIANGWGFRGNQAVHTGRGVATAVYGTLSEAVQAAVMGKVEPWGDAAPVRVQAPTRRDVLLDTVEALHDLLLNGSQPGQLRCALEIVALIAGDGYLVLPPVPVADKADLVASIDEVLSMGANPTLPLTVLLRGIAQLAEAESALLRRAA